MRLPLSFSLAMAALLGAAAPSHAEPLLITGAGATFPAPLYQKWFSDYNKANPNIQINYQAIGSGGGIKAISEKTVDFGASDAPLTDEQLAKAGGVQHIPTVMGAVVVTWNEPDVKSLKLSAETLAAIFLGKITSWNDPAIAKDNPGATLPATPLSVAHRSDGSGTTAIFTDYLSKAAPEWKEKVGQGTSVNWPTGLGAKGNDGVTGMVKSTRGAVGYVELLYANQNKLPVAELKNHDGVFVKPSLEGVAAAAAAVPMPADYRVSITDQPGKTAYPIASFTYLLVPKDNANVEKGTALLHFIRWAVHQGQKDAAPMDYAPLPKAVVAKVDATLKSLKVGGKEVLAHGK